MNIYLVNKFKKWATNHRVTDASLKSAAKEIRAGNYDANLGGGLYKKRIALGSKGKSGGARTYIAYQVGENLYFITGHTKKEQDNITLKEKKALKDFAKILLNLDTVAFNKLIRNGVLIPLS